MASPERAPIPNADRGEAEWGTEHRIRAIPPKPPIAAAVWGPAQVTGCGDLEVVRIADIQRGFVDRDQLRGAGLGRGAIRHRISGGRLHPYHPGVYLVGRRSLEPLGAEMAAVLFYRGHAILSHRTAAAIWGLLAPIPGDVTMTAVAVDRRSRTGVRVRRVQTLDRRDLRLREGLPLTSPPRTIVDLAGEEADLEEAVAVALQRGLASPREIEAAMHRVPHHKGAPRLRALLATGDASGFTRSKGERRLRQLLNAADLPQPRANVPLLGYVADLLWPEYKLIVEFDGFRWHSSRSAFEHDRRRDQRFAAAGYTVMRVTRRQLLGEPFAVIARIAQALAARTA